MQRDQSIKSKARELKAGPLRMQFVNGELRYLCWGEREVLRRVYVAVRDCWWRTVPARISNLELQISDEAFRVSFIAAHQQDEIDFRWHGVVTGDAQGALTFTMEGEAQSDFLRNRIGLCVLHPPECAHAACRVEHDDGSVTEGVFPRFIAPHQPFINIRAITHAPLPGTQAEVRFAGDVFEMEDQRNWTDGSFKTYSTPLSLPFPVAVNAGERIHQSCTLSVGQDRLLSHTPSEAIALCINESETGYDPVPPRLPQIGLALGKQPPSPSDIAALRALNLSHLRVDLVLSQSDCQATLARAVADARALNARLEAALFLSDNAAQELRELQQAAAQLNAPIARWLIFHQAEQVTAERWLALARAVLGSGAPLVAGTNHYFTELNRQRPSAEWLRIADGVCYSLNPQVHATDDDTLIESLSAQAATVTSARQFAGALPLVISPVTLKPRFNPHEPQAGAEPPADVRQGSAFAAAWTLGSLKYLAESGAESVTFYETTGPRGVVATPTWRVLAQVAECIGAEVLRVTSSAPLKVIGLALRHRAGLRLSVANLSDAPQSVRIEGAAQLNESLTLQPHEIAVLNEQ